MAKKARNEVCVHDSPEKDVSSRMFRGSGTPPENDALVPLLCCVCPETPKFSDVSHLLTHVASKGHLHHETQTKLKAHQDVAAATTLRNYELWYQQYCIEALLVERMKAKQLKETSKSRRSRIGSLDICGNDKRKNKRLMESSSIKREDSEDLFSSLDINFFPALLHNDHGLTTPEDSVMGSEPMSLKGQIWPGMGKLDLADEEMRRTRNQRKPPSVVDKMKKTSEGIEPSQVVMTPEWEVDFVKTVYDETPHPSEDEAPVKKKLPKIKRKAGRALSEISVNIPRGNAIRGASGSRPAKLTKPRRPLNSTKSQSRSGASESHLEIFRDEPDAAETYDLGTLNDHDLRPNLRTRLEHNSQYATIQSPFLSPSPALRDSPDSGGLIRGSRDFGWQAHGFFDSPSGLLSTTGSCHNGSHGADEISIFNNSTRFPFTGNGLFNLTAPEPFRIGSYYPLKHEDFNDGDSILGNRIYPYFNIPTNNPLFAGSLNQAANPTMFSPLVDLPIVQQESDSQESLARPSFTPSGLSSEG